MNATRAAILVLLVGCVRLGPGGEQPSQIDTDDTSSPSKPSDGVETRVRVVTWNIESLGAAGSEELEAVATVLARLDADVVGINEVDEFENGRLKDLAAELGYDVVVPDSNPFGELRNAMLTRLPILEETIWQSDDLSGDADANDLTRWPVSMTVQAGATALTVVVQHWKSGFEDIDEFRRAVDSIRTTQAAGEGGGDHVIVMGDVNHEVDDGAEAPDPFTTIPSGAPSSYWLGADLYEQLGSGGIRNDPFVPLHAAGFVDLDAQQADGRWDTRDESGRRIDYILIDEGLAAAVEATLVYDSRDDDMVTVELAGDPPPRETSASASDHFPVLVDILVD